MGAKLLVRLPVADCADAAERLGHAVFERAGTAVVSEAAGHRGAADKLGHAVFEPVGTADVSEADCADAAERLGHAVFERVGTAVVSEAAADV